jgi:hypothetical protein
MSIAHDKKLRRTAYVKTRNTISTCAIGLKTVGHCPICTNIRLGISKLSESFSLFRTQMIKRFRQIIIIIILHKQIAKK